MLSLSISLAGPVVGFEGTVYFKDKTAWEQALAEPSETYETENFSDKLLNEGISYVSSESGGINTKFGYYHDVLVSYSQNEPMTIWSFNSPIYAYGGTWTLGGPGGSGNYLRVYINEVSDDNLVGFINSSYSNDFWGFISNVAFTSVWLVGGTGSNQQTYKLDDMVYSFEEL
jgi:hypothetical protein